MTRGGVLSSRCRICLIDSKFHIREVDVAKNQNDLMVGHYPVPLPVPRLLVLGRGRVLGQGLKEGILGLYDAHTDVD